MQRSRVTVAAAFVFSVWLTHANHASATASGHAGSPTEAPRGECATLPRPRMTVRLTIADSGANDTAAGAAAAVIMRTVDDVWRSEGIAFDWASDRPLGPTWNGVDVWIAVVPGMHAGSEGRMGEVLFLKEEPSPMIRISLDAVTAWVRRDQATRFMSKTNFNNLLLGDTATLLPVALGYVAAHEIGHFVLASRRHTPRGLMQAHYEHPRTLSELSTAGLDAASRTRLRQRLLLSAGCD